MKFIVLLSVLIFSLGSIYAQKEPNRLGLEDLTPPSKEDLINLNVSIASKEEEGIYNAPGIISVITAKEIERFGANNLTEVLERVTSVYIVGTYFTPNNIISIRGDNNNTPYNTHVLLLINGRPTREILFGGIDYPILLAFPIAAIDRIEVIRGPGSVLYGSNAFTGVVNIITKKGFDNATEIEAGYGSFGSANFQFANTKTKDDLQILTALKYFNQDGWKYNAIGEPTQVDESLANDTLDFRSGQNNLGAALNVNYKKFSLNSFVTYSAQNHTGVLPVVTYPDIASIGASQPFRNREMETIRAFLDLGYTFNYWNGKGRLDVNSTLNLTNTRFSNPSGTVDGFARDGLLEATQFINFSNKLNLITGGTIYVQSGNIEIGDSDARGLDSFTENWYSAYSQLKYLVNDNIILFAGLQFNKPAGIPSDLVPRLGAIFKITPSLGLKVLYGEAYRAPFQAEQDYQDPGILIGRPNLRPERQQTIEGQIFYRRPNFSISANYFASYKESLITRFRGAGTGTTYVNDLGLNTRGLEIEGKLSVSQGFFLVGSFTWTDIDNGSEGSTALARLNRVSLMPTVLGKLGIFYDWKKRIQIGLFDSYFGNAQKAESIDISDPVQEVNADAAAYHFVTLKLDFNLYNIFNYAKVMVGETNTSENIILSLYATNLGDAQVFYPEFVRREINTLPGRGGMAFFGSVKFNF